ncbi:MAG: hypothetical protein ACK56I_21125, partial [bacterium]
MGTGNSGAGGSLTLSAGRTTYATGLGGAVSVLSGASVSSGSGGVTIASSDVESAGVAGVVTVSSGSSASGDSGS